MSIVDKIKKANLVGRGGACYPTAKKWQMVKEAQANVKYVVCNCSEGEPGVKKDGYLIEKHADRIIDGMRLALEFLSSGINGEKIETKGYFYINQEYFKKYKKILEQAIIKAKSVAAGPFEIEIFVKPHEAGYIGGEESAALNVIEGKKAEPRSKPPYPTTAGLFGKPTLVNNVETFYNVSLAAQGKYRKTRFYTIAGDCLYEGVYEFPEDWPIDKILRATHNYPKYEFFVQVGGDGAGVVLNKKQLKQPAVGAASIHVYSLEKYQPQKLMLAWVEFFACESCGQCTPCREGTYRLQEILNQSKPDWNTVADLLANLRETALCGLGAAVPIPIESYVKNVLEIYPEKKTNLPLGNKNIICGCFN